MIGVVFWSVVATLRVSASQALGSQVRTWTTWRWWLTTNYRRSMKISTWISWTTSASTSCSTINLLSCNRRYACEMLFLRYDGTSVMITVAGLIPIFLRSLFISHTEAHWRQPVNVSRIVNRGGILMYPEMI